MRAIASVLLAVCLCGMARGQAGTERMIVVAPLVGAGTVEDPVRPLGMPARGLPAGVLGMTYVLSDNQKLAIVEITALKRAAIAAVAQTLSASAQAAQVRTFQPHLHSAAEVETAIRAVKKDFKLDAFREVRP